MVKKKDRCSDIKSGLLLAVIWLPDMTQLDGIKVLIRLIPPAPPKYCFFSVSIECIGLAHINQGFRDLRDTDHARMY